MKIEKISPFIDVPILFISATNKQRLLKALEVQLKYLKIENKIKTSVLNNTMLPLIEHILLQR